MEQNTEPINKPTPLFDRGSKHMQCTKDGLLNKWHQEKWTDTFRKMKLDHLLMPQE